MSLTNENAEYICLENCLKQPQATSVTGWEGEVSRLGLLTYFFRQLDTRLMTSAWSLLERQGW